MPRLNAAALKRIVHALFDVVENRSTDTEMTIICPQPGCGDSSGNRSINLQTGVTNCWRCGVAGPLVKWAAKLGHEIDTDDEGLYFDNDLKLEGLEFTKKTGEMVPYVNDITLPSGFVPLADEPDSGYARLVARMAKRKNLTLEDFIAARAGFTRTNPRWEPYCIFPTHEWDNLVYYQGRTYSDTPGESTKRFPSKYEIPLGSRYWVYNIDALRQKTARKAVVVEAIFNVLSLKRVLRDPSVVPIAVFKHKLSRAQVFKIAQCRHLEEVNLMFDSDATGEAWASCAGLVNQFEVTVTEMPHKVDPNDDAVRALELFGKRRKFSSVSRLDYLVRDL